MPENQKNKLSEASPSVQAHLGILQNVIDRMSSNSNSTKAWCVTLVSAILVVVADKGKPNFAWIALIPTLRFASLDIYYLALEKGFRNGYNAFTNKLHDGKLETSDLYSVDSVGKQSCLRFKAAASFSVWGFYGAILLMIALTRWLVL
jgi:hypothetical protein